MSEKHYLVTRPIHGDEVILVKATSQRDAMNRVNLDYGVTVESKIYKTSKATSAREQDK
jgi:hypothetical protein